MGKMKSGDQKLPQVGSASSPRSSGSHHYRENTADHIKRSVKNNSHHMRIGSQLDEDSLLMTSKFQNSFAMGSIDDSGGFNNLGASHSKRPEMGKSKQFASPRSKNANIKIPGPQKKLSVIDSLYESLRSLARSNLETPDRPNFDYQMTLADSIAKGNQLEEPQVSNAEAVLSAVESPTLENDKSFILSTGNIRHDDRVILYTIREFLGTCYSITLNVPITGQNWVVFVSTSENLKELSRIWKMRPKKDHKSMLTSWLLSCSTIEFEDLLITKAGFDHEEFRRKYMRELLISVKGATISIQRVVRGYLARLRFRAAVHKIKRLKDAQDRAAERNKHHRAVLDARKKNPDGLQESLPPNAGSPVIKSIKFDSPAKVKRNATIQSEKQMIGDKILDVYTPGHNRKKLDAREKQDELKENVSLIKEELGGAISNFQRELEDIREQIALAKLMKQNGGGANNFQYQQSHEGSISPLDGPSFISQHGPLNYSEVDSHRNDFAGIHGPDGIGKIQEMNNVLELKSELSRVVMKVGNLEDLLEIQKKAFEKVEGKAKLEIAKARLAAELAAERAAERVRAEAIAEMQFKLQESEQRFRAEEEQKKNQMYEKLYSEESRKRDRDRDVVVNANSANASLDGSISSLNKLPASSQMPQQSKKSFFPGWNVVAAAAKSGNAAALVKGGVPPASTGTRKDPVNSPTSEAPTFFQQQQRQGGAGPPPAVAAQLIPSAPSRNNQSGLPLSKGPPSNSRPGKAKAAAPGESNYKPEAQKKLNIVTPVGDLTALNPDVKKVPVQNSVLLNAMVELMGNNAKNLGFAVEEEVEIIVKAPMTKEEGEIIRNRALTTFASRYHLNKGRHPGGARLTLLLRVIDEITDVRLIQVSIALSVHTYNSSLASRATTKLLAVLEGMGIKSSDKLPLLDFESITSLLNCFAGNTVVLDPALDVINFIIKVTGGEEGNNVKLDELSETGLCDVLMRILAEHFKDSNLAFKITKSLGRLTLKNEANKLLVGRVENYRIMKSTMLAQMKLPNILENAMKTAVNCVIDCTSNQDTVWDSGIIDAIMQAFEEYIKIDRILGVACRCVINMTAHNHEKNQSRFMIGNRPMLFKTAIGMHKKKPKLLEQLIWSVLGLISNHKTNKKLLQKVGLLSVLVKLLNLDETPPGVVVCAVWATSNLASVNNKKLENVNLLILEALKVLEKQTTFPDINRHAKMALNRVFGNTTGRNSPKTPATPVEGSPRGRKGSQEEDNDSDGDYQDS